MFEKTEEPEHTVGSSLGQMIEEMLTMPPVDPKEYEPPKPEDNSNTRSMNETIGKDVQSLSLSTLPAVKDTARATTPTLGNRIEERLTGLGLPREQSRNLGDLVGGLSGVDSVVEALNNGTDADFYRELALSALTLVPGTGKALKEGSTAARDAIKVVSDTVKKPTFTKKSLSPEDLEKLGKAGPPPSAVKSTTPPTVERWQALEAEQFAKAAGKDGVPDLDAIRTAKEARKVADEMDQILAKGFETAQTELSTSSSNVTSAVNSIAKEVDRLTVLGVNGAKGEGIDGLINIQAHLAQYDTLVTEAGALLKMLEQFPANAVVKNKYDDVLIKLKKREHEVLKSVEKIKKFKQDTSLKEVK